MEVDPPILPPPPPVQGQHGLQHSVVISQVPPPPIAAPQIPPAITGTTATTTLVPLTPPSTTASGATPRAPFEEWLRTMNKFSDLASSDEVRVKCLQDLMEQIDQIVSHSSYQVYLDGSIPAFLNYLTKYSAPEYLQESTRHQCRKLVIEIIHRLPSNEPLRPHVRSIVSTMFKIVETDNEEIVVNCLRIIIELHKQFRPPLTTETQQFLNFVKTVFRDIQGKMDRIFEQKQLLKLDDINDQTIKPLLDEIFAVTPVQNLSTPGEKPKNLIPRASNSLKVLQELPIIVVLMYQIYKQNVQNEVAEYIPVIITTISLHPTEIQR